MGGEGMGREGEGRGGRERGKGKGRRIRTPLRIGLVTGLYKVLNQIWSDFGRTIRSLILELK